MPVCLEFMHICLKRCIKANLELHCIKKKELLKLLYFKILKYAFLAEPRSMDMQKDIKSTFKTH